MFSEGHLKETNSLEDLGTEETKILNISKQQNEVWTGLVWLGIKQVMGCGKRRNCFRFHEIQGVSWLSEGY
jgi:hypothetical protein